MEELIPILGMLVTFGTIFGITYFAIITRHRERMALIERGLDISIFTKKRSSNTFMYLRIGLFFTGCGLGVALGNLFYIVTDMPQGASYPSMIILCGGLFLVLSYLIQIKTEKKLGQEK